MKHLISTLVVFVVFAVNALFADSSMRIEYLNGEQYQASIDALSARWEIDGINEKFRLVAMDGTVLAERNLYDDIRRIVIFENNNGGTVDTENDLLAVKIYPNPARELINIENVKAGETIRIYSMDGQLLITETAGTTSLAISVKSLSNGVYLLQVGTEIVKLIKQ